MNSYLALKERHKREIDDFPFIFAFSSEQFAEGMAKFGLAPDETDKLCKLSIPGGFCRRTDEPRLQEMFAQHARDREEAIAADSTGGGYIFEMFRYELANREYGYTWDVEETLDALGFSMEDIEKNDALLHGFEKATASFKEDE